MSTAQSITLQGREFTLVRWPWRPGWRITRGIVQAAGGLIEGLLNDGGAANAGGVKIDVAKLAGVLDDSAQDLVAEILTHGLDFSKFSETERAAFLESLSFEDALYAVEMVLRTNLVFQRGALAGLMKKSSAPSTTPQLS